MMTPRTRVAPRESAAELSMGIADGGKRDHEMRQLLDAGEADGDVERGPGIVEDRNGASEGAGSVGGATQRVPAVAVGASVSVA